MPDDTRPSGSETARPIADGRARSLVSIVIPSYNCERYIRQTLQGIVAQTISDWEVIVVDDGSIDAAVAIAQPSTRACASCSSPVGTLLP